MNNKDYLNAIHKKIIYRKIKDNVIGSIGAVAICLFIFLSFQEIDNNLIFNDLYESISYYEWEVFDDVSSDDIYHYLIDNTCLEDYDTIDDENMLELIENLNLGG